jgi:conserved hypothetical protein
MTALEKMALEIVQKQAKNVKKENEKREQLAAGFTFVKPVSASAKKVIQQLEAMMIDGYAKIDNTNGAFMPVVIEQVGENQISIAHYYEQNGDLMADPEIVFLKKEYSYGVEYYPIYERMSGLCSDVELVIFENRKPKMISNLQKQTASFCTTWMRTIAMQQSIGK